MTTLRALILTLAAAVTMAAGPVLNPVPPPGKAVFFGLHFIDTSGLRTGPEGEQEARLKLTEDLIAADLESRGFTVLRPPADKVADISNPTRSNGRDTKIAADMGADYAVSGQVQKVSNLILSINLYIRDAQTAQTLRAGAVDIRGNTDESFQRGARYLLKNIVFRTE